MSDQPDPAPVDASDNDKTAAAGSNIDCDSAPAPLPPNDTPNEPEKDHTNHQEATDSDKCDDNGDQTSNKSRELKSLLASSKEANLNTNISHKRKKEQLPKHQADGEPRRPGKLAVEGKNYKFPVTAEAELGDSSEYPGKAHGESLTLGKRKRDSISENSSNTTDTEDCNRRNKKLTLGDFVSFKPNKDIFCWRCHREGVNIVCETCPRSYHQKCLKQTITDTSHWPCPECVAILKAESTQTRSTAMKEMTLEHLCSLLKFAANRMIQCHGSEPFLHPVSDKEFPEYKKYIIQPMDLTMLEKNIKDNLYGSTQAFEADAKWLLHNSIIFNSYRSKLTSAAKTMIKICKQEMMEIENCPSCYLKANTKKSTWFVQVCPKPHILVWAKLKGFPYWPAKAMSISPNGMVDVRFFGAHDRAWVHYKDCYLYSKKDPNTFKQKRYDIEKCVEELDIYIDNLKKEYGEFRYAPFRTPLSSENMHQQLVIFLPNYKAVQARRRSFRESIDAKSEESDIETVSKDEDKSDSEESRSNTNSPIRDNDTTMEGYGTDDDVSSDLDHDSRKSQQEKKRSKFRKTEDDDDVDNENEDDDDTQVASNISVEKALIRGNVRTRGGFNNATGKIRVLQMKALLDDTSSPNEKQRARRNSDLSVKSDSSRVSNYSDKISRINIVENVEITLGNEDVGCLISETLNGDNPKSEGDIKIKPVQVEVENAEFSISPNRVKIADQLIKKLRDENAEKVTKSLMDVDNEEVSQINGKTDDDDEPKENFKQKLKNAYLTILPELPSLPTESQASTSVDENCVSEEESPSDLHRKEEINSKNPVDDIKNDEASSDTSIHESSEESLPNEPVTSSSKEDESPKPKPVQLIELSFDENNTSIPESISEKIRNLESGELSISRTKSVRSAVEKPRVIQSKETNLKSSKDAEDCEEESHEHDASDKDANKKKEESSEGKRALETKRKRSTDGTLPDKIKKLESSELSISTVTTKTVSEKDNSIKENSNKHNKNEKDRTVNIFEDLDDDEETGIVDNVALDKGSIIDVIHSSLKYPEKDKETNNKDKNEGNASKKRKLLSDKLNSPAKLVKLVSIESILGNKDNDKDHSEAMIAPENIKSEPESEEENANDEAQMEEKRKYLFALNIHEKSLVSEKKEKETNQIRTRSKAEEQREKSKVDNLSRVIDEVAMNCSSEAPQKKLERRKSRSGPPEGEIYVKSFAKIPTPPPPPPHAKQRARKSFPTPLYVKQPLKPQLAKKDLSAFRKDAATPRNLAPAPEKDVGATPNGGAKAFPSPPPLVATGSVQTGAEKGAQPSTFTAVRAVGLGPAATGGLQQSVALGHVILMSAPTVNYGSTLNSSALNVVSHQNSSLTTTTATLIPQTQKSVLKANALNKTLNVKTSQNYIPHEDAENSGSSSPSVIINSNSQNSNEPSNKQKSQEPSVTSTNSNIDSTGATSKPTNNSINNTNNNNNNSTQPVIEQEDEFSILNGLIPESVSRAVSELLLRPPPRLRPRPPGIVSQSFEETVPSSAGDVTAKVNSIAHRMTDYFRGMLIETLEDIGKTPSPEAKITSLQLEIEALKHRHNLEMTEMRKNMCTILKDIQRSIVEEKEKIVEETRAACEVETIKRVESAKLKQWCASCSKEAQFYCCWNTSYCDYPCQQKHWPNHAGKCTQNIEKGAAGSGAVPLLPPCTIGQPILLRPALARPKPMGMDVCRRWDDKTIRKNELCDARVQKCNRMREEEAGQFSIDQPGSEEQLRDIKLERKRKLARECSRRYRDKKRLCAKNNTSK
ncbi:unnamed protein product [Phyllotreta striolata]|uniref:MYND-type domain-containing protein n=1 Tax=Phyllotreta striolata TaxID=444603 RepID=A0A9P0GRY5_PHYSR|nr:unnamed protein product [Phyllotreta striolata]